MIDLFIPYEQSLELKKLGFNEKCFGVYINGRFEPRYKSTNSKFKPNLKLDKRGVAYCTAVLWQQGFDYLRNKGYENYISKSFGCYNINILMYDSKGDVNFDVSDELTFKDYSSYQEARLACLEIGLQEALKLLP